MFAIFFRDGTVVPRIKDDSKSNTVVWEAEVYKTKAEAEAKAEAIRGIRMRVYIGDDCVGESGFDVIVKEV